VSPASPQRSPLETAFEELYETLAHGLELVALRALGDRDEASEVVQESMARAFDAVRSQRVPDTVPLGAFVRGIARHVIADALRRRARTPGDRLPDTIPLAVPLPSALDALISGERERLVRTAFAALGRNDRALLERCVMDGETVVEIASMWGVPAERLRKQKSRALARLRVLLRERGHAHPDETDNQQ
jgi:RNA polymerase sigma-70 factor (ECF subfamily)